MSIAASRPLSDSIVDRYHREGVLLVDLPADLQALLDQFANETRVWIKHFVGVDIDVARLPSELVRVAKLDRASVGKLYKVSRRFLSSKQIASHPWLAQASAQLMATPIVSCCHFVNVRFDLPEEDKFLLPVHQDFPYIQGSLNGLTWWIPFFDCPADQGPPSFVHGSHRDGVVPVRYYALGDVGGSGGKSFSIEDEMEYSDKIFTTAPLMAGQAFVFSTLALHRSEPNQSGEARINVQVRFDDPLAAESYERNYPEGLYLGDTLNKTYPEYLAEKN